MFPLCRNCSTEDLQKSIIYVGLADLMLGLLRFYLFQWATESKCDRSITWISIVITLALVTQILADLILVIGAAKERVNCILAYLITIPLLFLLTIILATIIIIMYLKCLSLYIYYGIPLHVATPAFWLLTFAYYKELKEQVIFGLPPPVPIARLDGHRPRPPQPPITNAPRPPTQQRNAGRPPPPPSPI